MAAMVAAAFVSSCAHGQASRYFVIRVVDEETGRGVPLVELRFLNDVKYWTDSAGVAAVDEPSFRGREVSLGIRSHGYVYPQKIIFEQNVVVKFEPGKVHELRVRRTMIAERLYRLTGEGIYRDSVLGWREIPGRCPGLV